MKIRPRTLTMLAAAALLGATPAAAGEWTANLGWHNPANSTYGLNFLWFGSEFGFEAGIGYVDVKADSKEEDSTTTEGKKKSSTAIHVAGGLDGKYFFTAGKVRPYLQAGFGLGIGASAGDDTGASAGTGGGYGGLGLMFGSPAFYAYASYNINGSKDTFPQAGIGIGL